MFKSICITPTNTFEVVGLTNIKLHTLQQYLYENNNVLIERYFEELLVDHTNADVSMLTVIDKFLLLLKLRSISVGSQIQVMMSADTNIVIDIEHIINTVSAINTKHTLDYMLYTVQLDVGRAFTYSGALDHIRMFNQLDLYSISSTEYQSVVSVIPATPVLLSQISDFRESVIKAFDKVFIIPPISALNYDGIKINPLLNLFDILKNIFKEDLMSLYKLKYIAMSKLNISPSEYDQMLPADSRIFINMLSQEIEDQSKQLK